MPLKHTPLVQSAQTAQDQARCVPGAALLQECDSPQPCRSTAGACTRGAPAGAARAFWPVCMDTSSLPRWNTTSNGCAAVRAATPMNSPGLAERFPPNLSTCARAKLTPLARYIAARAMHAETFASCCMRCADTKCAPTLLRAYRARQGPRPDWSSVPHSTPCRAIVGHTRYWSPALPGARAPGRPPGRPPGDPAPPGRRRSAGA